MFCSCLWNVFDFKHTSSKVDFIVTLCALLFFCLHIYWNKIQQHRVTQIETNVRLFHQFCFKERFSSSSSSLFGYTWVFYHMPEHLSYSFYTCMCVCGWNCVQIICSICQEANALRARRRRKAEQKIIEKWMKFTCVFSERKSCGKKAMKCERCFAFLPVVCVAFKSPEDHCHSRANLSKKVKKCVTLRASLSLTHLPSLELFIAFISPRVFVYVQNTMAPWNQFWLSAQLSKHNRKANIALMLLYTRFHAQKVWMSKRKVEEEEDVEKKKETEKE